MAIEVEKLIFAAEAELKQFERDMNKIPQVVEDVSRKAQQKAAKYAAANERIQKNFADAGIKEQRRLTNEVLREIERRNRAEQKLTQRRASSGQGFRGSFSGNVAADVVSNITSEVKDLAVQGVKLNASLDHLVRFTSTLDKNFQTPVALRQFKEDIKQLSTEIPHSAEKIAEASFSIKSAFANLNRQETIEFLRQFGLGATASNADIAEFTKNTIALAKVFKVDMKDLPNFMAKVNATFKDGLAADSEISQGFNRTITSIQTLKLSQDDYLALMSTVQSSTADAAGAVTNLQSLFAKLNDAKYIEGLKKIFNIDRFTKDGNLKSVPIVINEIAKSLENLTDKEKTEKINAVFKDLEANKAVVTIIGNIDKLNEKLKDVSGAEGFKNTQNLMMDSIESRWTRMWNNIKNDQSGVGGSITDFFLSAFDSTTVLGGITIFFNNLGGAFLQSLATLGASIAAPISDFSDWVLSSLGFSEADISANRAKFDKFWNDLSKGITQITDSNTRSILENQKKSWQKVAETTANPETRQKALANVQSLTKAIQQSMDSSGVATYKSWENIGKQAIEGLKSNEQKIKAQAETTLIETLKTIHTEVNNPKNSEGMRKAYGELFNQLSHSISSNELAAKVQDAIFETLDKAETSINQGKPQITNALNSLVQINPDIARDSGFQLGNTLTQSVSQSIEQGRQPVQQAQNNLFGNTNTQFVTSSGFKIGTSLWQGIVGGINSGRGEVVGASASLGMIAANATRQSVDSRSPSKVFQKIGQDIVSGLIIGLDDNSPKIAKSIQKMTKEAIDSAYEEIGQIYSDFQALRDPKMFGIKIKLADASETKSKLEELIDLRIKLGANLNIPLPTAGNVGAELVALRQFNKELNEIADLTDSFKTSKSAGETIFGQLAKLDEVSQTKGFFRLAEEAGKSVEEFKEAIKSGAMAEYLEAITKVDEQLSDSGVTSEIQKRAAAVERMSQAYEGIFNEQHQQEFANSFGIKTPTITSVDNETPPEFKKLKTEFEGLSDFLNQTFTDLRQGGWRGMLEGMATDLTDALQRMFVTWITSQIYRAFNVPIGANTNGGGGFWSKLLGIGISALGGGLRGAATGSLISTVNGITNTIKPVGLPVTFRAGGGDVTAHRPHIVGEKGWELFIPDTSGTILNQRQLQAYSSAPNYNFGNIANNSGNGQSNNNRGGNLAPIVQNFNFYPDPQTGTFSKSSAQQVTKRIIDQQRREAGRR